MNELIDFDIVCDDPPTPCPRCDGPVATSRFELLDAVTTSAPHCECCGVVFAA